MASNTKSNGQDKDQAGAAKSRRDVVRAAARHPSRALRSTRHAAAQPRASGREPPHLFVSYSHRDITIVAALVDRLRDSGATVAWDQDFTGGMDFERAIRGAIDAAHCAIVVWSCDSVQSHFVRDEARRALVAGKLITTHVAGFDVADVPLGFGHLHTIQVDDQDRMRRSLAERGIRLGA